MTTTARPARGRTPESPDAEPPCGGCGGPHPYDTSIPSAVWNRVIRAAGLSDYLCPACIVGAFVRAGESFTATLWGAVPDDRTGVPIEVRIGSAEARDAQLLCAENTRLRAALASDDAAVRRAALDAACRAVGEQR